MSKYKHYILAKRNNDREFLSYLINKMSRIQKENPEYTVTYDPLFNCINVTAKNGKSLDIVEDLRTHLRRN